MWITGPFPPNFDEISGSFRKFRLTFFPALHSPVNHTFLKEEKGFLSLIGSALPVELITLQEELNVLRYTFQILSCTFPLILGFSSEKSISKTP